MLDIRLLRDQPELVKERLHTRSSEFSKSVDKVLEADKRRRDIETRLQQFQAERNRLSRQIGGMRGRGEDTSHIEAQVKEFSEELTKLAQESSTQDANLRQMLWEIPNLPQADVPLGVDASDNPILRTWGEKPSIDAPKDHVVLAENLRLFDVVRATKISGSGFACYTGKGARLERALINFLLDIHTVDHGYVEISPPYLIRPECMVGTGQLPKFVEDMYGVDGGELYLAPTAEVPVTNLHREEIVSFDVLPIKYVAYTPCFRREAGSTGRDTRGLIRLHQFDKVELVKICHPDQSAVELESLTKNAERILQLLGLHYQVIELCTGDLGFSAAKTYDIEVWAPGQGGYLEVSSCSNFEDYQARRMNLRFKDEKGKNRFCHTLNGSGTALARLYVALLEQCQQPDGSIKLPSVLHSYIGSDCLI